MNLVRITAEIRPWRASHLWHYGALRFIRLPCISSISFFGLRRVSRYMFIHLPAKLSLSGPRNESCHSVFTRVFLQVLIQFKAQIARGYADSNAMRRRKFQQAVLATLYLLRRLVVLLPQQQYSQHTRGHDWLRQDRSCANLRRNGWKQGPG